MVAIAVTPKVAPALTGSEIPGGVLADALFQSFCLGIIGCMAMKYFSTYGKDSKRMRGYVALIVALAILQCILEDYKIWRVAITRKTWGSNSLGWSDIFLNGLVCFFCEAFLVYRCWKVTRRSYWVLTPMALLTVSVFAANIWLAVVVQKAANRIPANNDSLRASRYLSPTVVIAYSYWSFGSLVIDASITIILINFFRASRLGVGTEWRLTRLIQLAWESAVPPSISMIIALSLYHSKPGPTDHLALFFTLITGKLYTIGLLRTINSRAKLLKQVNARDLGRTSLPGYPQVRCSMLPASIEPYGEIAGSKRYAGIGDSQRYSKQTGQHAPSKELQLPPTVHERERPSIGSDTTRFSDDS
ncbi:hypothetical protein PLICRDRAFT_169669 [Plicaturopsis crispa FD-325 SS-3]|nr:hypothetical protein PLICRDRAFT_169669 [Plicaturopsis crispa FD-325 SS-3]